VTLTVHRRGTHILHALLYDKDFRLVAEHQVAFVHLTLNPKPQTLNPTPAKP